MSTAAFAVWVTGPERASVETLAGDLGRRLAARLPVELLDAHTPIDATGAAFVAGVLVRHGIAAVVALPAGRAVRDSARAAVGRLIEVYVHAADAPSGGDYEPPERAEVEIVTPTPSHGASVDRVLHTLEVLGFLTREPDRAYSEAEEREVIRRLKAFGYL